LRALPGRAHQLVVERVRLGADGRRHRRPPLPDPSGDHRQGRGGAAPHPDRSGRGGGPRPRLGGHRVRDHGARQGHGHHAVTAQHPVTTGAGPQAAPAAATGLLVSDVDSTFLTQEVIELVAEHAGVRDRVEEITTAAMRGELDFAQSLRARVALLEGLEESVLEQVREALVPTDGALELVARARAAGWVTALVSGGFHEVIDPLAARAGIDHVVANRFEIRQGRFTGEVLGPIIDGTAKLRTLQQLSERYGVPASRVVAIGDGANDRQMLEAAGVGIAFRAKPALREVADAVIDSRSLLDAWEHLEGVRVG